MCTKGLPISSRPRHLFALAAVLAIALLATPAANASTLGIRVSGNRLLDGAGAPLSVAGVNRSGAEYACAEGWGIFDGPVDDASIAAIASWGVNAVRLPLNEDCWLGINGVNPAYGGANYQAAIEDYVNRLLAHGLDVILDLHWGAPGAQLALGQEEAPDADHAPDFWSSVAAQFKGVSGIAYDLFNEPHDISWSCWLNGCFTPEFYEAAGEQQLINAVRDTGATQPVIVEGLDWGGDLSSWLANEPSDPAQQMVAGWHTYNFGSCNNVSCWNQTVAPVASQVPVLATEVGEDDCAGNYLSALLPWADSHEIGYLAWAWNAASCGAGPSLIADYTGTPTPYGAWYKAYLASRPAPAPTPPPTPTPNPPPTPPPPKPSRKPTTRFDFENGTTQGWALRWGHKLAVANEKGIAYSGSHGLSLSISGAGSPAAGATTNLHGIGRRTIVTYHLWEPAHASISVSPALLDSASHKVVLANQTLKPGWNTVKFTIPTKVSSVHMLGLKINNRGGWTGRLVLDAISITPD